MATVKGKQEHEILSMAWNSVWFGIGITPLHFAIKRISSRQNRNNKLFC